MAIAGVGSLAASLADGLAREGRVILGGDLAFTLIQREAAPNERAFLDAHGKTSSAATLRAMARTAGGQATLVEMKAVDAAYPLFGQTLLDPPGTLAEALAQRDGVFGAVADPTLMARLELKPGARLTVGNAIVEIRAALTSEPDKLAGGIGFGPRLLVSQDALRATGLLQPGSLVRWHYRLRLSRRGFRCDDESNRDAGTCAIARGRLGYPQPEQCLAATRAQCRALYAIPHHRRLDRASGRRRRRWQRGQKSSRPPTRDNRHHEGARCDWAPRIRDLSHASSVAGACRGHDRRFARRHSPVRDFMDVRRHYSLAYRARIASG